MTLKRTISAAIALFVLAAVLFLPLFVFAAVVFIVSIIASFEFHRSMKKAGRKPFIIFPLLTSLLIPLVSYAFETAMDAMLFIKVAAAFLLMLFIILISVFVLSHSKRDLMDLFITVFSMLYLAPFLACLVFIRFFDYGIYHIFIAFGGAWMTDNTAYFIGRWLGKKKLIPNISPNKTWAGAIGGLAGTMISIPVYGHILNTSIYEQGIGIWPFIVLAVFLAVFSQFGDLFASAIKRYAEIKDFGNLMPGHGGAIDRLDSVLFTSGITFVFILMYF